MIILMIYLSTCLGGGEFLSPCLKLIGKQNRIIFVSRFINVKNTTKSKKKFDEF